MKQPKIWALWAGLILAGCASSVPASATATGSFDAFLNSVRRDAVADGVSSATVDQAFQDLSPNDRVVTLDQAQPEKKLLFGQYIRKTLDPYRIKKGRAALHNNAARLQAARARYGVPPALIVALWGMESNFGANTGGFQVVESLATLAYEGRRASFFRGELIAALHILDRENMGAQELTGSWAGAMGQCQFMPSTYLHYAADGNGDGRVDIWSSEADVIESIARYIAAEGWKPGVTWGREVRLTRKLPLRLIGLDTARPLSFWSARGVRSHSGNPLPKNNIQASLIQPDGPGGRAFLVYDNFRALMRWNHSTYFGLSVGLLADRLS